MVRRYSIGSVTACVVVLAALGVSCGADEQAAPVPATETPTPELPTAPGAEVAGVTEERPAVSPELVDRLRSTVLVVSSEGCGFDRQGSLSLVDLAGSPLAMSNRHVLAGAVEATVTLPDGTALALPVGGAVPDRDAAVLDPDATAAAGLTLDALPVGSAPEVGDEVVVAGHPDGRFSAVTGRVTAIEERADDGGTVGVILVDAPSVEGASGGVVVDLEGRAVGLVAARDPDTGSSVAYPFSALTGPLDQRPPSC